MTNWSIAISGTNIVGTDKLQRIYPRNDDPFREEDCSDADKREHNKQLSPVTIHFGGKAEDCDGRLERNQHGNGGRDDLETSVG